MEWFYFGAPARDSLISTITRLGWLSGYSRMHFPGARVECRARAALGAGGATLIPALVHAERSTLNTSGAEPRLNLSVNVFK